MRKKTQHAFRKEIGMIITWDIQWSWLDLLSPVKCDQYGDNASKRFKMYEITKVEKKENQNKTKTAMK